MKVQEVDRLPNGGMEFLTITESARAEIENLGNMKPQGAFRIRCDIQATKTNIYFEWDDRFTQDDFIVDERGAFPIVMDATSIAYILDEYTLDHQGRFSLSKNRLGALRHQK